MTVLHSRFGLDSILDVDIVLSVESSVLMLLMLSLSLLLLFLLFVSILELNFFEEY